MEKKHINHIIGEKDLEWKDIIGEEDKDKSFKELWDDDYEKVLKELISERLIATEEYMNEYGKEITVTCNNETKTTNSMMGYVYFEITESGEYSIEATASDGSKGTTAAKVTILAITPEEATIYEEETATLAVTGSSEEIIWRSSDESIVTVENGVVTGVKKGTARITPTNADGTAISNSCEVTVKAPTITVDPTSLTLYDDETATLAVSGTSRSVTWESSDTSVATVSNGTIAAVGEGTVTITVKNQTGTAEAHCHVTVNESTKLDGAMVLKNTTAGDDTMTNIGMTTSKENRATITSEGIVKCGTEIGWVDITVIENGKSIVYRLKSTAKIVYTASSTAPIKGTVSYNNPVIPEGYSAIDTQDAKWDLTATTQPDVNKGLVIMDEEGNQFVWVPVPNVIYDSSNVSSLPTSFNTGSKTTGHNYTPMAINVSTATGQSQNGTFNSDGEYKGLLYDYDSTNGAYLKYGSNATKNYQEGPFAYIEPDVIYYDWQSQYTSYEITNTNLKNEYNKMIENVNTYGGFYIGRYESSLINGKTKSVSNSTSMDSSSSSANMWYGLYQKQKNYLTTSNGEKITEGNMIYGSQYDAMMNWMITNGIEDVTSSTPITGAEKNTTRKTGTVSKDKLKNVFDLLGNTTDLTQEGYWDNYRVGRGGRFNVNAWSLCHRGPCSAIGTSADDCGSRLSLNIK